MIERLAWVTTRAARGRDEDEDVALAALRRAGVEVDVVDWDDAGVDWSAYDRAVLRSTWDYPDRLAEFLPWLDRVAAATDLVNPPATVRWSLDKHYLRELEAAGVAVTPTAFLLPGEAPTWPDGDFVVKPAVGAGSRDTATYGPEDVEVAAAHVARLHAADRAVLVQPFLASVATDGEWPLVYLDGAFSHAASKRVAVPRAGSVEDLFAEETNAPHEATPAQVALGDAAVRVVTDLLGTPAYARVDVVRDDAGEHCVLEVEMVEPSLFLPYAEPAAVDRLVAALTRPGPGAAPG